MADDELRRFVESALSAGASKSEIERVLIQARWSAEQIADALAAYADVDFIVPIPSPASSTSARDAFLYCIVFGALYLSAYNIGALLFDFVNLAFPDALESRPEAVYPSMRWSISAILVGYPVFLYTSYRVQREVGRDPLRRTSAVRRWLTHLTLFVAAAVLAGDVIALLFNLLAGDLTARIVLKTLVVGVIAGTAFAYYLAYSRADHAAVEGSREDPP